MARSASKTSPPRVVTDTPPPLFDATDRVADSDPVAQPGGHHLADPDGSPTIRSCSGPPVGAEQPLEVGARVGIEQGMEGREVAALRREAASVATRKYARPVSVRRLRRIQVSKVWLSRDWAPGAVRPIQWHLARQSLNR